ncbi:Luciferase-like monooxygenase [Pseudarthrobacter chlorophenolicus A6]|uniref:Luciferase-like monooxygenase n=1 Tax=Pseudarthrobacter chlorophenolicus (strain ATCC 700700 / DSM 12829 / CIP 107037 / JCM 12360 / KCTC 9906 / NCIMB 13794 / A6) TaxID=452863 RepID=B8H9Q8_PSECP|nr:LLM class flavin-dependent oxidoreductase [Pseudarthrobacter chlorophenolicus]ACL38292.1 Luciferase-like monooxygenase [Pseudarthrobacter chlorophenolicus A6]SDQ51571.1 luciferase family oxidoreductase, group 1 [Pseudarthrobacter chlorophenolicus]
MPTASPVPLSVLDLSPAPAGQSAGDALRNSIDLAVAAEDLGYRRFWLAEHHLNPGVAGSAPHVLSALVAAATRTIRVGTAATILGNYRPLQVAENIGTLAAVYPDRLDLGFGRSGQPSAPVADSTDAGRTTAEPAANAHGSGAGGAGAIAAGASGAAHSAGSAGSGSAGAGSAGAGSAGSGSAGSGSAGADVPEQPGEGARVVDGLLVPAARRLFNSVLPRKFRLQAELLGREPGDADNFESEVQDVIGFFTGRYRTRHGEEITVTPARGTAPQFWIHGSTAGPSARLAGKLGLPFGANYHVSPATVLDSVAEYRAHFKPSAALAEPYVTVSADVLVADDKESARTLGAGYASWVHSIRTGHGAIPYPAPRDGGRLDAQATAPETGAPDLIRDRVETRFVGGPAQVADQLRALQHATGAQELLITSIAHSQRHRVRSYELLAAEWGLS